jgi:alanine racemase
VVKADAYGHGAEVLAEEYEKLGADWFAVSNLEEAAQLRKAGAKLPILILGYTPACMASELARLGIAQAVLCAEYGEELSAEAVKAGVTVRVHVKLDTGMSRIGFLYQDPERDASSIDAVARVCALPGLCAEGIFTHFAVADEGDAGEEFTRKQFGNFNGAVGLLRERGVDFQIRHCANSAAVFEYPEMQLDMVRPGNVLYGLKPSGDVRSEMDLVPAMSLKSVVSLVKTVEPETGVSYGRTFVTSGRTTLATVPVGYADGYPRILSGRADALVRGRRARIVGRVCMDQLMLDVTGIEGVREGDTVTLFGRDGEERITTDELAGIAGTINYELVCGISKRVPRVYLRGGREVGRMNFLCD